MRRRLAFFVAALLTTVSAIVASPTAAGAAEAADDTVTVRIDPSYRNPAFEGWGTSLVWFANITGGYPDEIRNRLADMLFGDDGLRLNIARYNIGGGNAPDVRRDYMKVGATMEGFWKAPPGTTRADMDWWDPANPDHWNWDTDANQRWWIDRIKSTVDTWEAFSNSPPWFQTVSGYVSGGFNGGTDQIRPDTVDDFATYLVKVAEHIERSHGIRFDTIDPLNEPNTTYWSTTLGPDGQPVGGRQEGAHAGPASQQQVILALKAALGGSHTKVSAMDETNPGIFTTNWNAYTAAARAAVDQLNVHTYGTGQRTSARDIAKGSHKKLWMSEVEGSWGTGTDYTSMVPGLGIATRIVDDLRELEPSAWVFWQPVEDSIPQQAGGGNWGSIHIPFTCTAASTLDTCPIRTNSKFHTIRNFTHFIRPGDHLVRTDNPNTVAAVAASGRAAVAVHVNADNGTRTVALDLGSFAHTARGATVTPVVTSAGGALVRGKPVRVHHGRATLTVPAQSVTTFLIDGVSGVAADAALVQPGHVYRFRGVQSGRSIAPAGDGVVIRTDAVAADQVWSVRQVSGGTSHRARYTVDSAVDGRRLAMRDGALVLEAGGAVDDAAQWILSTTGDGTYTVVDAATGRLLDVPGQATADGSPVSTYTPTSGANQRWTIVDETPLGTERVRTHTVPRRVPDLPATVTPTYRDGPRGALPVVWTMPPESRWRRPGTVRVGGVATDVLGRRVRAEAVVVVDTFTRTETATAKTYVGGRPELPSTVVGIGRHGGRADLPVTWDPPPPFDRVGTVTVTGTARVADGTTVPARVRVTVTEPVEVNAARTDGVTLTATYTEPGYSTDGLHNGNRTDKAWSNWRSGPKNPTDTITVTLPTTRDLTRVVTHFHQDGTNTSSAAGLRVQVRAADGSWADASAEIPVPDVPAPVIDVPVTTAGPTAEVRIVLTARPNGYMTISEIEVYAKAPA